MSKSMFPLMRIMILMAILVGLTQCKIGQSSTGGEGGAQTAKKDRVYTPDQCTISAKVLYESSPGVYALRVYQVLKAGMGFNHSLNPGDKIEVWSPIGLTEKETVEINIEWVKAKEGGRYEMSTGAQ